MSSIDVIVPCYRYAHFLRQCVESVLSQDVSQIRVLILDDASPDDTPNVARAIAVKDSRVTVVRHTTNRGHIATFNEGIDWARADYMLLLSADDYLTPHSLGRAVGVMDRHPEVGLTFGKALELRDSDLAADLQLQSLTQHCGPPKVLSGIDYIVQSGCRNIVPTPTAVVRTSVQKQVGGYRSTLPHSGDMEMWLRFAARAGVAQLDGYQAVYRQHDTNMSLAYYGSGRLPDIQQRRAAIDSFFDSCEALLPDPARLRRRIYRALGREALGFASAAFNDHELAASNQLCALALLLDPAASHSWPWLKLALKRSIGPDAWCRVHAFTRR
jgi:glycosyltransferase involved in cell wall biosynthesis